MRVGPRVSVTARDAADRQPSDRRNSSVFEDIYNINRKSIAYSATFLVRLMV